MIYVALLSAFELLLSEVSAVGNAARGVRAGGAYLGQAQALDSPAQGCLDISPWVAHLVQLPQRLQR